MLSLKITATEIADLRQYRPPKQVLGFLPCGFSPVSVFILLRNVHLFNEPSYRLGSQRVRRAPV